MNTSLSPGDILALLLVLTVLSVAAYFSEPEAESYEMTPAELDQAYDEAWEAQGSKYLDEMSLVDPFNIDGLIDNPHIVLGPAKIEPECVDTYKRTDISCDDKAAVIKYRNQLQDLEIKRLQEDIKRKEKELQREQFGQMEV